MKLPDFEIHYDDDPLLRAYRRSVWEHDAMDQEPIPVGNNVLILPWDSRCGDDSGRIVLRLDSRYAFGDGRHPTTTLCLALLEEYLEGLTSSERKQYAMLDMGTGSGVLSILASRMGVANILAVDIDPDAIESAREQAGRNGCDTIGFRVMDAALLPPVPAYGLITANLLPPVLRSVIPLAAQLILPGAPVIVSGIGDTSRDEMETLMRDSGFTEIHRATSGWWHGYLLRK